MPKFFTKKNLVFISLFTLLGFLALQVPFTTIMGSKTKFTLFDFFGPVTTGFIGVVPGIISVFLMQFVNFLIHGAKVVDAGTIIRFFPMLFAAFYFCKKSKANIIIPALAIIAFNLHPIGRTAWFFSLYWLIPIFCHFLREKSLVARSLGATFTAHSIGSTLFLYALNIPKAAWVSLIPIVAIERGLFALGIAGMYLLFNNLLNLLTEKKWLPNEPLINKKYLFKPRTSSL
jgi:hypothetical protein